MIVFARRLRRLDQMVRYPLPIDAAPAAPRELLLPVTERSDVKQRASVAELTEAELDNLSGSVRQEDEPEVAHAMTEACGLRPLAYSDSEYFERE